MKPLEEFKDELEKCVRCGTCRSVCPTFRVLGRETACARGKLTLIGSYLGSEIPQSDEYVRHIKECTLCGACKGSCPNGVDTTGVFAAARADVAKNKGLPFAANLIFKNLVSPGKTVPLALKLASRFQGIFLKDAPAENGLLARFPLPLVGAVMASNRLLPPLAGTPFLDLPEVKGLGVPVAHPSGPRVAFYAGCGVNYLMPNVGSASIDVLKRAGATVIVPQGQVCCGMPAYSTGDLGSAREMALKNLEVFEAHSLDYIVTSCATCGYGLKKLFRDLLFEVPELRARVEAFSSRVRDITELLAHDLDFTGKGRGMAGSPVRVTYHDPCHLGRAQGVRDEPRELIAGAQGVELKEMKHPCSCCGLGGGLSLSNYDLSIEITRRKAESVRDTGADVVVTACPGCMVQLRDAMHRYGVKAKVAHVVELL
ncbi:MAG: (Fe-S)-binding protein [Deltaproteobacteria bacterium]|nr:(Fe-S)-binding protein [Deltaproteobacteria bacterium]